MDLPAPGTGHIFFGVQHPVDLMACFMGNRKMPAAIIGIAVYQLLLYQNGLSIQEERLRIFQVIIDGNLCLAKYCKPMDVPIQGEGMVFYLEAKQFRCQKVRVDISIGFTLMDWQLPIGGNNTLCNRFNLLPTQIRQFSFPLF